MNSFKLPARLQPISGQGLLVNSKRILLLLLLLQGLTLWVNGQSTVARGKVVNEANLPVSGASVQVKNSTIGTSTDEEGNFVITLPAANSVLVFSTVGYTQRELPASSNMNVQLQPLDNSLGEVVVVGYGTQRRVSVTGAVDKVGASAIEGKPVENVSQALQGVSPNL